MVNPEFIVNLFFELSNVSRIEILIAIDKEPLKQSQLSKDLDLTIQETSRHLSRLCDARLSHRNLDGLYTTTPLGKHLLSLLPEVSFLSANANYFATHDSTVIPPHLRYGLGLIRDYESAPHVMDAFRQVEQLIRNAEQFVWIISDQVLSSSLQLLDEAMQRGVEFKVILPRDIVEQNNENLQHPHAAESEHDIPEGRLASSVNIVNIVSEKKACLAFPTLDGKLDYLGFLVSNPEAIEWCKELFLHHWNQSSEY